MTQLLHYSALRNMARSPMHYRYALDNPSEPTKAQRLGDATDAILYGHKEVLVSDCASRRGKAWDKFVEEAPADSVLIVPAEHDLCCSMAKAIESNKLAMALLDGERQKTVKWKIGNRECEGTPDSVGPARVVELKTGRTSHPDYFPYDARKLFYHAQLSWYRTGLNMPEASCYIVAVESAPPHPVTIFKCTDGAMEAGLKLWRLWFERLMVCEQTNIWPGYSEAVCPLDTPDTEPATLIIAGEEVDVE